MTATRNFITVLIKLVAVIILALLIKQYVFFISVVPTGSMLGTLNIGDRFICVNKFFLDDITYDDIVVFIPNTGEKNYWTKRVIGLPGDNIYIKHGIIYRNGELLEEPYISSQDDYTCSFSVPEGKYFLLGDNRADSEDARYWENPFISEDDILYKVLYKVYPFNEMGVVK